MLGLGWSSSKLVVDDNDIHGWGGCGGGDGCGLGWLTRMVLVDGVVGYWWVLEGVGIVGGGGEGGG